ncbi:MAG: molybdopterin-dependent oxidoreductase, partial [bacterium]
GPNAIGVILSPRMTNEDLYAARLLFRETLKLKNVVSKVPPREKGYQDNFLIKADKNPNTQGAKLLQLSSRGRSVSKMLKAATNRKLRALYICHHDLKIGFSLADLESAFSNLELIIFQGTNQNSTSALAHYLLPSATFVEKDGTFTNFAKRVQRVHRAVEPLGESKPDWIIFRNLSKKLGKSMPYFEAEDVFNAMAEEVSAFRGLSYKKIGDQGIVLNGQEGLTEAEVEAKVA